MSRRNESQLIEAHRREMTDALNKQKAALNEKHKIELDEQHSVLIAQHVLQTAALRGDLAMALKREIEASNARQNLILEASAHQAELDKQKARHAAEIKTFRRVLEASTKRELACETICRDLKQQLNDSQVSYRKWLFPISPTYIISAESVELDGPKAQVEKLRKDLLLQTNHMGSAIRYWKARVTNMGLEIQKLREQAAHTDLALRVAREANEFAEKASVKTFQICDAFKKVVDTMCGPAVSSALIAQAINNTEDKKDNADRKNTGSNSGTVAAPEQQIRKCEQSAGDVAAKCCSVPDTGTIKSAAVRQLDFSHWGWIDYSIFNGWPTPYDPANG